MKIFFVCLAPTKSYEAENLLVKLVILNPQIVDNYFSNENIKIVKLMLMSEISTLSDENNQDNLSNS
jgi:hypothetical protein